MLHLQFRLHLNQFLLDQSFQRLPVLQAGQHLTADHEHGNARNARLEAQQVVLKTLDTSTAEERGDWGVMQEKIRADLKRYLTKQTSRRPLIMPVILEL
jgi:mRNA degradation ribonuclease J1/J2